MDRNGKALTPIITTGQAELAEAEWIEDRIGKSRHLKITGAGRFGRDQFDDVGLVSGERARPPAKADLVGQLNTFLHRQITGAGHGPVDASFTGLYETLKLGGGAKSSARIWA